MPLAVNNQSADFYRNVEILRHRKRGDIYYSKNGYLKKMSFIQKIFFIASKIFNSAHFHKTQSDIKDTINWVVNSLETSDKKLASNFFFKKLASLSENIYDRSQIKESIQAMLRETLREEGGQKNKAYKYSKFNEKLLDTKLATCLGVRPVKPGIGCSESFILKDINHRKVGIFKTSTGDSLSKMAPFLPLRYRNKLLYFIGFGGSIFRYIAGKCHIAEMASYKMAKKINSTSVPTTKIVKLDPLRFRRKKEAIKEGSFQLFVENAVEARKFLNVHKKYIKAVASKKRTIANKLPRDLAEDLIINDVIEGNMDRHAENWLVQAKNHKATNIVLIDGGIAFSPTHANTHFERHKLYRWATLKLKFAQKRFSLKAKERIKDIYNKRFELKDTLYKIYVSKGDEEYLASKRANRMVERIEMLHWFANIKDLRIYKLSDYKTSKEVQKVRSDLEKIEQTRGLDKDLFRF